MVARAIGHSLVAGMTIVPMIALATAFLMEAIWAPGPHLPSQVRDHIPPAHTERNWDISIHFKIFPKDRTGLLDAIEHSARERGGATLARTPSTVTVLTDRPNGETLLAAARAAEKTPLGQEYLAWAHQNPAPAPTGDQPDTVLTASVGLPVTTHSLTVPMLLTSGTIAGISFILFIMLCASGIRFEIF